MNTSNGIYNLVYKQNWNPNIDISIDILTLRCDNSLLSIVLHLT